jgi:serine/threonine-protein kinase
MNSQHDPLIGREMDGYLVDKLLGKGGMACVYRGQDVRLGRYVAIKLIEAQARADPERARSLLEALV